MLSVRTTYLINSFIVLEIYSSMELVVVQFVISLSDYEIIWDNFLKNTVALFDVIYVR